MKAGVFNTLDLDFDGETLAFAWSECAKYPEDADRSGQPFGWSMEEAKKRSRANYYWAPDTCYHIFKFRLGEEKVEQLTDGAFQDFDPCFLPNGRIVFMSERRGGYLRCGNNRPNPSYTLHAMIYLVDCFGNRELIWRDPEVACLDPIPLRARPRPPVLPAATCQALVDRKEGDPETASVAILNVYDSDFEWPKDTKIAGIRVIQLFPKANYFKDRPNIGHASESLVRGVVGTAPIRDLCRWRGSASRASWNRHRTARIR